MSLSAIAPEHATTLHTEECDQMLIVTADLCVSVGELMRIRDVSVCLNALIVSLLVYSFVYSEIVDSTLPDMLGYSMVWC